MVMKTNRRVKRMLLRNKMMVKNLVVMGVLVV
jgi:hypothetical protein